MRLVGAERLGGADMRFRNALHDRIERQDHIGQQHMRHRHQHAEAVEDSSKRLLHEPRHCNALLIGPLPCRRMIQAVVRTRSDVQNGRSTQIMSSPAEPR